MGQYPSVLNWNLVSLKLRIVWVKILCWNSNWKEGKRLRRDAPRHDKSGQKTMEAVDKIKGSVKSLWGLKDSKNGHRMFSY